MSGLEMNEFMRFNASLRGLGADPGKIQPIEVLAPWTTLFRSKAEKRQQKNQQTLALMAQAEEQKAHAAALAEDEKTFLAREQFRQRVENKLDEIDKEAQATAREIANVRELAADPELQGQEDLLQQTLADLNGFEAALVEVQAATAIDAGTLDTEELAQSFADGQAALLAIRSIRGRAAGMVDMLTKRRQQLRDQAIEDKRALREATERAAFDQRRAETAVREAELAAAARATEQEQKQRAQIMQAVFSLDSEIDKEQRAIQRLRAELDSLHLAAQRKQQQAALTQDKLAAARSIQSGIKAGIA